MTVVPSAFAGTLLYAFYWPSNVITYGFPQKGAAGELSQFDYTEEPTAPGYIGLNPAQQSQVTAAVLAWDQLIAPQFSLVIDTTSIGNLRFAFSDYKELQDVWGYAYVGGRKSGDIWINADYSHSTFRTGGYDYMAALHEIGHGIGLKHSFEATGFDKAFDNTLYTVMSYTHVEQRHVTFVHNGATLTASGVGIYASTPMVLDIAAAQERYGADTTTAIGNDVYTFAQDAPFVRSIYDAGGIDTIDVSAHTRGSIIDLSPGGYSSIAQYTVADQIADAVARFGAGYTSFITSALNRGDAHTWTNNLGIAFTTTIENAIGSADADDITGNAADNRLEGRAGNDLIRAGAGNDTLFGGAGDDIIDGDAGWDIMWGGTGSDRTNFAFALAQGGVGVFGAGIIVGGIGELNFLSEIETVVFTDGTVTLADADPLIDDLYYYGMNLDVWAAKADADTHYKTSGWKEGRDPHFLFDTKGYLAAYADARDAANQGMDPLTHYLTVGWKKGYDPSVRFDTSSYLAAYADVAASGVNPLAHYVTTGQFEFRDPFADGGF